MTKMEPIAKASEASALPQSQTAAVQLQPEVGVAPQSARRARFPWFAMLSFLFVVCGPVGAIVWYLEERAAEAKADRDEAIAEAEAGRCTEAEAAWPSRPGPAAPSAVPS